MTRLGTSTSLAIVGLLLANLALDLGMIWYVEDNRPGASWLGHTVMSAVIGQIFLLGFWLGLGDGRWYWRLLVTVSLTTCIAKTFGWGSEWSYNSRDEGNAETWPIILFFLIFLMLASCVPVLPLRRLRRWRLTWQPGVESATLPQFQIGDILLWMMPIGAVLGLMRFLGSLIDNGWQSLLDSLLPIAEIAGLSFFTMLAAFAKRRRMFAAVALLCLALLVGSAFAAPEVYRDALRAQTVVRGPIAWQVYVSNAFPIVIKHLLTALCCASFAWMNCTVLRSLGCRLIRPGNHLTRPTTQASHDHAGPAYGADTPG